MRLIQTMLTLLVILTVFLTPLQAGCCMVMPIPQQELETKTGGSCCISKMAAIQTDIPTAPPLAPCKSREGQCPRCTHTVMAQHGCATDQLVFTQDSNIELTPCLSFALCTLSADHPIWRPVAVDLTVIATKLNTARTLCAQHTLLTV